MALSSTIIVSVISRSKAYRRHIQGRQRLAGHFRQFWHRADRWLRDDRQLDGDAAASASWVDRLLDQPAVEVLAFAEAVDGVESPAGTPLTIAALPAQQRFGTP